MENDKLGQEWFKQAEYDLIAAETLFKGGQYIYTVFMCHLAIEKALKGLYREKLNQAPPRTHILTFFLKKLDLPTPQELLSFLESMDAVSAPIRYPRDLETLLGEYDQNRAQKILDQSRELIKWIKEK